MRTKVFWVGVSVLTRQRNWLFRVSGYSNNLESPWRWRQHSPPKRKYRGRATKLGAGQPEPEELALHSVLQTVSPLTRTVRRCSKQSSAHARSLRAYLQSALTCGRRAVVTRRHIRKDFNLRAQYYSNSVDTTARFIVTSITTNFFRMRNILTKTWYPYKLKCLRGLNRTFDMGL
jgi:hypothetical protein